MNSYCKRFARACPAVFAGMMLGCLVISRAEANGADWPGWRGPSRDGRVPSFSAPAQWPKNLQRLWRIPVGEGHASPVVQSDRVFILSRQGEKEVVRAVRLDDGQELWQQSYLAPFEPSPWALGHGKGPKATPVVADGKLFTVGIDSIVSCWDTERGTLLWRRQFSERFKRISPYFYGMAVSPLVHGDRLLAFAGRYGEGAFMALDTATGKTVWEWTGDGPGYASPIVAAIDGVEQVITQSQNACVGLSVGEGKLLWSIAFKTDYDQNIVTPVVAGGLVIFAGLSKPTTAYRLVQTRGQWAPEKVWENSELSMYMSSPVVVGDRLVGFSNRKKGQFFCLDLATGKTLWASEGRMGDNAALLVAGDTVLALTTERRLIVFRAATSGFAPLAEYSVSDQPTWAHPAIVGNRVIIKDKSTLACWTW